MRNHPPKSAEVIAIEQAFAEVATLREQAAQQPALQDALRAVKTFQSERFAINYQDLLQHPLYAEATRFFLTELYGVRDFSARDSQFARIAKRIAQFFPASVLQLALDMAKLHALSEKLDLQLAQQCVLIAGNATAITVSPPLNLSIEIYVHAWRKLMKDDERQQQLQQVLGIAQQLSHLVGVSGIGISLRLMRLPARKAQLQDLQHFLETGFHAFAKLAKKHDTLNHFMYSVETRESLLLAALASKDAKTGTAYLKALHTSL